MKVDIVLNGALSWSLGLGWVENAVNLGIFHSLHFATAENALDTLHRVAQRPGDVVLFLCADQHMPFLHDTEEKRRALKNIGATTVCIASEAVIHTPFVEHSVPKGLRARECYDYILCQDERDVDFFSDGEAKAAFCPLAADSERFLPTVDFEARDRKAVFFGQTTPFFNNPAYYYDRRRILRGLEEFEHFRQIEQYIAANIDPAALADVVGRSYITLCLPTNVGGVSTRIFEALACGSLILHYRLHEQPVISAMLEDRVTCVLYDAHDVAGLKRLITELVEDVPFARKVAENGRAEFLKRHSIKQRMRQILYYVQSGDTSLSVPWDVPADFYPDFVKSERLKISRGA